MRNALTPYYLTLHKASGISAGDIVRVVRTAEDYELGWAYPAFEDFDKLVGKEFPVLTDEGELGFKLDTGKARGMTRWLPFYTLELVKKCKPPTTVQLNYDYKAEIYSDKINIISKGSLIWALPLSLVDELVKAKNTVLK